MTKFYAKNFSTGSNPETNVRAGSDRVVEYATQGSFNGNFERLQPRHFTRLYRDHQRAGHRANGCFSGLGWVERSHKVSNWHDGHRPYGAARQHKGERNWLASNS